MSAVTAPESAAVLSENRQAEWLFERALLEIACGSVVAFIAAALVRGTLPAPQLYAWLGITLAVYLARFLWQRAVTVDGSRTAAISHGGIAASGLTWGILGFLVTTALPASGAATGLCFIVAVTTYVVAVYSAAFIPALAFTAAAMLPTLAGTLLAGVPGARIASLAVFAFTVIVGMGVGLVRRFVPDALRDSSERDQAEIQARLYKAEIEKLHVAAKSSAEQRAEAERELRRVSADLGLLKSKTHVLSQTLERVSPLCPVTRLPNRRSFDHAIVREWDRALRDRKALSLALCEVDYFKDYQQQYGNQSADVLLQKVADQLRQVGKRAPDLAARYSDAQFALLWPGTDTRNALRMAEDARRRVETAAIPLDLENLPAQVTIRAGVATVVPSGDLEPKEILDRVDSALQQAAVGGANTVVQHRALYSYRLERWNSQHDGPFTEQSLVRKILHWGFEGKRITYHPGMNLPDSAVDHELLKAMTSGELVVILDGQRMTLRQGDCVFVPPGVTMSIAVVGTTPAVGIDGRRRAV